jgi:formylglycine-generating enzyme required for sulfatase activity
MKKKNNIWIYLLVITGVFLITANSCKKDESKSKIDPVLTWESPADITYGTLLSTTQLNATANVSGTFVYTPAIGTKLNVGDNQDIKVDFTPEDVITYNTASKTVKINVNAKINPVISWSNPADITVGTLLSSTQLNATADVSGTFVYTPPIGTSLSIGSNQDLNVDFTPTDAATYNNVNKTVKINVIANSIPSYIQMVNIPAGTFTMGSPTGEAMRRIDEAQYQVTLSAFRMSKYEITNAQYAAFLNAKSIGANGKYAAGAYPTEVLIYATSLTYSGSQWIPETGYENNPVIKVTWYGATEFATDIGCKLPTEAQWEYACRAGTITPFNTGNCLTDAQANYYWVSPYNSCTNNNGPYPGKTQPVGTYAANAFGLFDMHGNSLEWCSDWYDTYPTTAQINPTGPLSGSFRVYRGGCYYYDARDCRSADRGFEDYPHSYTYSEHVGFRVVLVP